MRERSQVFTAVLKMSDQLAQMDVCVAEMNIVLHSLYLTYLKTV